MSALFAHRKGLSLEAQHPRNTGPVQIHVDDAHLQSQPGKGKRQIDRHHAFPDAPLPAQNDQLVPDMLHARLHRDRLGGHLLDHFGVIRKLQILQNRFQILFHIRTPLSMAFDKKNNYNPIFPGFQPSFSILSS